MINKTIYEDGNGGQLLLKNNDIAITESLVTLAYIAMFGGNIEADTKPKADTIEIQVDWWGNNKDNQSSTWINSETERTLTGIVLNSRSLETIKQAVEKDTQFLTEFGEVNISVNIVSLNRVKISIQTDQGENLSLIWDNTRNEIIETKWL